METRSGPYCVDVGPAATADTGLPVVLLHGWTGSKEDFAQIVDPLARIRRVIVPDLPGHGGRPAAADDDYGLGAHVRQVRELLDDAGIGDVHVIGHSHGGLIAQRIAYMAADRVASLTLIGTGPGAPADATCDVVRRVAIAVRDHGHEAGWTVLVEDRDGPADPREAAIRERFHAMPRGAIIGVARNLIIAAPLGAFLYGIDFPVLVCHGQDDQAWEPRQQRDLANRIPGAAYAVIPDAAHSPAVENPDGLLREVTPFLKRADLVVRRLSASMTPSTGKG